MSTTADTPTSPAAKLVRYSYVITLQFPMGGMNHAVMGDAGAIDVPEGYSRHGAFQELRKALMDSARRQGITGTPHTLFFSIERDTL